MYVFVPGCNILVFVLLIGLLQVVNGSDTPSNAEDLGNDAEELYRISPEPPEPVAFPAAFPTPPSSTPSFQSTPETLQIPVETLLSPALLSPPSGLLASATSTPSVNLDPENLLLEPSQEPAKETLESPLILSEPLKSVCTQAEVEESANLTASEPAADRVAVNPL